MLSTICRGRGAETTSSTFLLTRTLNMRVKSSKAEKSHRNDTTTAAAAASSVASVSRRKLFKDSHSPVVQHYRSHESTRQAGRQRKRRKGIWMDWKPESQITYSLVDPEFIFRFFSYTHFHLRRCALTEP